MRFWLITVGEPLPLRAGDKLMRAGLLAEHLAAKGHEVTWWSSTFDHVRKTYHCQGPLAIRLDSGVQLELLHAPPYSSNVSLARIRHQEATARAFIRAAPREPKPDAVLCSYPTIELASAAVRYARRVGAKVALDVRDLWPDICVDGLPLFLRPFGAAAIWYYDRIARSALRQADGLVGISDGYLAWALRKAGRAASPVTDTVLPFGFSRPAISERSMAAARSALTERGVRFEKMLAVFVGYFSDRQFDFDTVLRAARSLATSLPDLQIVLAGDGESARRLRREARGLPNVVLPGWIGRDEHAALLGAATFGLQCYSQKATMGLANKLFEYLGYGLALVSSLRGENAALIEQHACGVNYRPGDVEDLCAKLGELARRQGPLEEARRNARVLFEREFRLTSILERFVAYLTALSAPTRKTAPRVPLQDQQQPGLGPGDHDSAASEPL